MAFLYNRSRLPFVNPNVWSFMPLTAILITCPAFSLLQRDSRRQTVLGLLAAFNAGWVTLSTSRGSLLGALLSLAYLLVAVPNLRRSILYLGIGTLACLAVLSQHRDLESTTIKRFEILMDPTRSARQRTSGRFDLVLGGWYLFRDQPLGTGTGGFARSWSRLGPRQGLSEFHRGTATPAHSGWIKVLVENGAPGFLLLGAYVMSFALRGFRTGRQGYRRLGLFVSLAMTIAWLTAEFDFKGLWLLAGAVTALFIAPGDPRERQGG
jgi:hypothetical protein